MIFSVKYIFIGYFFLMLIGNGAERLPGLLSGKTQTQDTTGAIVLDSSAVSIETIASGLDVPWEMVWGPDNWIWFTEQGGRVSRINPETGEKKLLLKILPEVYRNRTLGLLCMALHPDMKTSPYVFLNYTYQKSSNLISKWVRYTYTGTTLNNPLTLLEVPADIGHNGSRIVIAPDGKLMLATGDADHKNDDSNSGNAQSLNTISGKILRMNIDGTVPADNPIPGSLIWALGFRVPQGLVYAANGNLYSAEHGNVNDDELNLIRRSGNYGYPKVLGKCDQPKEAGFCDSNKVIEPIAAWTPTIAPAGIDYYNHSAIPEWKNAILMVTLKSQSLRVLKLNQAGTQVVSEKIYLEKAFGRMRDVCVSPKGDVFISTSNLDWNPAEGFPKDNDDRILKISTLRKSSKEAKFPANKMVTSGKPVVKTAVVKPLPPGAQAYANYCASCHKANGNGVPGTFPPLRNAEQVTGNKEALVRILLHGLSGEIKVKGERYDQEMPAFGFLSDKEIAEVANYVRTQFGGQPGGVSPALVRSIRASPGNKKKL